MRGSRAAGTFCGCWGAAAAGTALAAWFPAHETPVRALVFDRAELFPGFASDGPAIVEERDPLEAVLEPYLIEQGYLQRPARGRVATLAAYRHFGIVAPAGFNDLL